MVLVAVDEHGGVVGYIPGSVHDDGEGFIDYVVVDPATRGAGVGGQLVMTATRLGADLRMTPLRSCGVEEADPRPGSTTHGPIASYPTTGDAAVRGGWRGG